MAIQTLPKTGQAVRAAMVEKRISQRQLADALDLTQAGVSRRLAGTVDFTVSELTAAAALLDYPIAELLPSPVDAPSDSTAVELGGASSRSEGSAA